MNQNQDKRIIIIGAGIAGCTSAIGLKKLGFDVTIIYKNRPFIAYEGFSEKTKEGLISQECINTSKLLAKQSLRNSNWANSSNQVNYEYVVCRKDLDEALLNDVKEKDIKMIEAKVVGSIDDKKDKAKITCKINENKFELSADFIVDARGRFTPFKDEYICGPQNFSLLQELEISDINENKTSIDSVKDGWVWQAYVGNKKGYIQFSCDEDFANKVNSFDDLLKILNMQDRGFWSLKNSKPIGKIVKRDSYCKIHKEIINTKMMLIGDSASSIDPLSGNGAFQAMSMSCIAPFVINTILNKKEYEQNVAINFYKSRVEFIFDKFTKVGKEFYCLEKRYKSDFWDKRQIWPKDKPVNNQMKLPRMEKRAVVNNSFIYENDVVITKDNPMGVWCFGNIVVSNLVKYCLEEKNEKSLEYFNSFCKEKHLDEKFYSSLKRWCISQEILEEVQ